MDETTAHERIRILTVAIVIMMALFVMRLFYMQIIEHDKYVALAQQEQVKSLIVPAQRGEIYALDGSNPVKLVLNEEVYTVFVDPTEVKDPDQVVDAVRAVSGGTAASDIDKLVRATPSRYKIVAKNVSRTQAEKLKSKKLSGLGFQKTTRRVYPEKQLASQVLGFVNAEGKGQYGVEESLDTRLKGTDGLLKSVTDVSNVPLTIGNQNIREPAKNGDNVVLTVDRNIQSYVEQTLGEHMDKIGAKKGSVLVMEPESGKVLAMANLPTYNPEQYNKVQDAAAFNNSTITSPYEPGSVMKTFTVATGIDQGVMSATSTYNNTDYIKVGDVTISNASKGQTGTITIQHALNWSLNTGMVTVAERLGDGSNINLAARTTMYRYMHDKFRLGEMTGIELAGEQPGEIISPNDVQGNAVRYATMSFGQGMNATMLQVASGFSSIINGGNYYSPTIIAGAVDGNGSFNKASEPKPVSQPISAETSKKAKKMIHDARAEFYSNVDKKGYDIGGKTGTSQTIINGSYDNNQTIGTYLGYGGDTKPRYVIMVQVSAPGKNFAGNTDAMPIFTDISNWMIDYMKLQPKE